MSWGQWGRALVVALVLGWLLLAPPTFRVETTGDVVTCRPIGLEWRQPVDLSGRLPSNQFDAVEHYVEQVEGADPLTVQEQLRAACGDAREDRQTLLIVVLAVVLGALVVRRGHLRTGSTTVSTTATSTGSSSAGPAQEA